MSSAIFENWAKERGLRAIEANYKRRTPAEEEELRVTQDGDPQWEKFYRTHYAVTGLSRKKTARLAEKLNRPHELIAFQKVSEEGACGWCGTELNKGSFLYKEREQILCLSSRV